MKKNPKKKAVVLLSGGLDSSTVAQYVLKKTNKEIYALTINYGQKHGIELDSSKKISKLISAVEHKIINLDLTLWGGSALTDCKITIPKNKDPNNLNQKKKSSIPITYVPARNTVFLALALSYAESINAEEIYIGVNSVDYSGYVDCRPDFIKKFQELADFATVKGVYGKKIKIKTPLINLSKSEIIKLGNKLGTDWSKTWSCYQGGIGKRKLACGECDSCFFRLKGFVEAGLKDRLNYNFHPDFYSNFIKSLD